MAKRHILTTEERRRGANKARAVSRERGTAHALTRQDASKGGKTKAALVKEAMGAKFIDPNNFLNPSAKELATAEKRLSYCRAHCLGMVKHITTCAYFYEKRILERERQEREAERAALATSGDDSDIDTCFMTEDT